MACGCGQGGLLRSARNDGIIEGRRDALNTALGTSPEVIPRNADIDVGLKFAHEGLCALDSHHGAKKSKG